MKETFSQRMRKAMQYRNIKQVDLVEKTKIGKSAISQYLSGAFLPKQTNTYLIAEALDVSVAWLMGYDVEMDRKAEGPSEFKYPSPNITEEYTTFPVIGDIAAGYDNIAIEEWEGDTVDIPDSFLIGRSRNEFFVLRVKGDSMYPTYQSGDKVLILKQSTLNYSGQIGAVMYDDEYATLKRVEYVMGEDWMKLVPINPNFPPKTIVGEDLEHCRVIGIPKLLIRDID